MMADSLLAWTSPVGRLVRTVGHMRPSQIARQIHHRVFRRTFGVPLPTSPGEVPVRSWRQPWRGPAYLPRREIAPGRFRILNETHDVRTAADWNAPGRPRLWLYNLHYLDDLAIPDISLAAEQRTLLETWIARNPPLHGAGWEPYPLSQRLVNEIKWCSRQPDIPAAWRRSVFQQAAALASQVEYHILGNHLFANAKALAFCGSFFSGSTADAWLDAGVTLLRQQVHEQFLPDGGHFERSPMYHAILLWDLCDLCHLIECVRLPALEAIAPVLEGALARGVRWLEAMIAVDGLVPFFNDSTLAVAPSLAQVRSFAAAAGCRNASANTAGMGLTHLPDSGFAVLHLGSGTKAIVDVGSVGPACQPGHAHAETLAFELGIRGRRAVVNCGISTYDTGPDRSYQRSTAAHTTVEVAGRDSSETWSSFRVGRRARVVGVATQETAEAMVVTAAHDGYRHLRGSPIHRRTIRATPRCLEVVDEVAGGEWPAVARFHLHPDARPTSAHAIVLPDDIRVTWHAESADARVVASQWHGEFGRSLASYCIEVPLTGGRSRVTMRW